MRKNITFILIGVLALSLLAGCGGRRSSQQETSEPAAIVYQVTDEDEARAVAEDFLAALQLLDTAKLQEICYPTAYASLGIDEDRARFIRESVLEEVDDTVVLSEESEQAIDAEITKMLRSELRGFQMGDARVDGNHMVIEAILTKAPSLSDITDLDLDGTFQKVTDEFYTAHEDELIEAFLEGGEEELLRQVNNGVYPLLFEQAALAIGNAEGVKYKVYITISADKDGYHVSQYTQEPYVEEASTEAPTEAFQPVEETEAEN